MSTDDHAPPFDGNDDGALDERVERDDASTIHHVDAIELRSLGVAAGLFYLTAFFVLALAIACVYLLAAGLGFIEQVEEFMRSIGFRGFRFVGPDVILGFVLILAALVAFLTVMTLVAGAFYNMLGTGRHGVRLRMTEVGPRRSRRERRAERREARLSAEVPAETTEVAATAPLAEEPAAAAAVVAAPLAAAVDEEKSVDDWVRAPDGQEPATKASAAEASDDVEASDDEAAAAEEPTTEKPAAKVSSTVKKAPTTAKRPATKPPARKKATTRKPVAAKADGADTDDGGSGARKVATPLVFEPVPDEPDGVGGNGAKAATSSDDDPDEPEPEAVAG